MKKIKAAAKVSKAAKLKALAGSTDVNASSSAPSMARASDSRATPAPLMQGAPAAETSPVGMQMPMQVKRGGAVKKRGLGGSLMGGMGGGGLPGMGGDDDKDKKRARGGSVKHHMTAGAGSGDGRLQKIGK